MNKKKWPTADGPDARSDTLAPYRAQAARALAPIAVLFLLPVAVSNLMHERLVLGTGMLFAVLILAVNGLALHFRRPPPLPVMLLLLATVGCSIPAIAAQGLAGALWSGPALLLFHLLLPPRQANLCGTVQLAAAALLLEHFRGLDEALGFAAPMLLLLMLSNIVLRFIEDLHRRLAAYSIRDPLTGAGNRRHMKRCLDAAIERYQRSATPATLLLVHIDRFRLLDDVHGRGAGEETLCLVAELIAERARRLDQLFRSAGHEFVLLLADTAESDAVRLAEDLRLAIAHGSLMQGRSVTVSIGVAQLRADEDREAWLEQAGNAVFIAKETGRDRIVRRAGLYLLKSGRA